MVKSAEDKHHYAEYYADGLFYMTALVAGDTRIVDGEEHQHTAEYREHEHA